MDTTVKWICPNCKYPEMETRGGNFGGRITTWNKKCPNCNFTLMIVPMKEGYEYSIRAESEMEIKRRLEKEKQLRELEQQVESLRRELH